MLPRISLSGEVYGSVKNSAAKGTVIAGILGDQQAALVGQTCFKSGEAKIIYGIGCFLLMNTGERAVRSKCGLLTTVGYKLGKHPAHYALEGSIAITGALVQWVRDNLGLIGKSPEIETLARTVEDNGGVYFVPAFSGLYAPYWKHDARGVIAGLTRYVNKGHLARAVLEATAFQTREVVEAMEKDSGIALDILRVDGGMVDEHAADAIPGRYSQPPGSEAADQGDHRPGCGLAAGLAVGFYKNTDDLRARWAADKTWNPALRRKQARRACIACGRKQ